MSQTIAQRADELLADAEAGAKAYAERVTAHAPHLARETALNYEVGILRDLVRRLSDSVELQAESIANQAAEIKRQTSAITMLNGTVKSQREQIRRNYEDMGEAGLLRGDDRDDARDYAAFVRSTGAAGALRGDA